MTDKAIKPFTISIPQAELDDLKRRLNHTRWPDQETVDDWSQGAPLAKVQALIEYWRTSYDWRRCEAALNRYPQFTAEIDGLDIYFLHIRSRHEAARPLLLTHGWPGSVLEFMKAVPGLIDPESHGGTAEDAFHLVIPSLPGFGFSGQPRENGWDVARIASAWGELMTRLGYDAWLAQGGDWGSIVTQKIGELAPAGCVGLHVNLLMPDASLFEEPNPTGLDQRGLECFAHYDAWDSGYAKQQSTRPQTIGYALADSPAGQAAWIYEKYWGWMDHEGDPGNILSMDEMLDNIMLYWLPNASASSARLYWESFRNLAMERIDLPIGVSVFPKEIFCIARERAANVMKNIVYWRETEKGGHFAAWEQPELFVAELRDCFRVIAK